jgi:formylglycine-generating enzyme required for sulfatase activity
MKRLLISFFLIFSVGCEQQLAKPLGARNPDTPEKARILQAQTAKDMNLPKQLTIKLPNSNVSMDFILIPAGTFHMGSPETEKSSWGDEEPLHYVVISKPFYMGKYEVTQLQYSRIIDISSENISLQSKSVMMGTTTSSGFYAGEATSQVGGKITHGTISHFSGWELPMENISWFGCITFTQALSRQFNEVFRLPTEAEWEYACRAGTITPFYTGETISAEQANYKASKVYGDGSQGHYVGMTTKVGSYPPNAFGLYDMHGNVSEWCSDWYGSKYYRDSPAIDPKGSFGGKHRVIRGGAWDQKPKLLRSAYRYNEDEDDYYPYIGFRVVLEINDISKFRKDIFSPVSVR